MDHTPRWAPTAATPASPTSTTPAGAHRASTSRASGTLEPARTASRAATPSRSTPAARGWRRGNDAPGIGADFKASLSRPGPWYACMEGYGETLPRHENSVLARTARSATVGPADARHRHDLRPKRARHAEGHRGAGRRDAEGRRLRGRAGLRRRADPGRGDPRDGNGPHGRAIRRRRCSTASTSATTSPNVFVTDGACMPSTACQNPSFTYMALTARACDYAIEQLKRGAI